MKKMAFVDLTNFKDWPRGGMLQYELTILPEMTRYFDIDLWGVSVNGEKNENIEINSKKYDINIFTNVKTTKRIIPNYWKGLGIIKYKRQFNKYDYIYVHTGSCASALYFVKSKNSKLIYHQHGLSHLNDRSLMSKIQRPFVNFAQHKSDLVFVVSDEESVKKEYIKNKKHIKGKYVNILSPIDLLNFSKRKTNNIKNNTLRIIYTGRLDSHKDVETIIYSLKEYEKIDKNFEFLIIGDGERFAQINSLIIKLNLCEKIKMIGSQSHNVVINELYKSNIYVTASIGEGMSLSVIEAYAAGVPVVCFNVPGLCKQIIDKKTGVVCKIRDYKTFAEGINTTKNNLKKYSNNCIEESYKYDVRAVCKIIINNINSLQVERREQHDE